VNPTSSYGRVVFLAFLIIALSIGINWWRDYAQTPGAKRRRAARQQLKARARLMALSDRREGSRRA